MAFGTVPVYVTMVTTFHKISNMSKICTVYYFCVTIIPIVEYVEEIITLDWIILSLQDEHGYIFTVLRHCNKSSWVNCQGNKPIRYATCLTNPAEIDSKVVLL